MNKELKIVASLLVLTSWLKGGLASQWNLWVVHFVVIAVAVAMLAKDRSLRKRFSQAITPLILMLLYGFVGFWNPSFKTLTLDEWNRINAEKYLSRETNLEKVALVSNGFRSIRAVQKDDPKLALAIFFDLRNTYFDRFGEGKSGCGDLITRYEDEISSQAIPYIPTSTIIDSRSILFFIDFLLQFSFGLVTYFLIRSRHEVRLFMWVICINASILAIVGIIQKMNYIPSDYAKEILGLWDAPEPRYFYSSFTYKNHWSAFVILSLFCCFSLLYYEFKNLKTKLIHCKAIFILLFSASSIVISVAHSGSRSGILILFVFFALALIFSASRLRRFKIQLFTFPLLFICVLFFSFMLNKETSKEMWGNTSMQIKSFSGDQKPMRLLFWTDLFQQIQTRTLWGNGHDSFRAINPIHQSREVRKRRTAGLEYAHSKYVPLVGHGHSDFLEFISEFGIIGLMTISVYFLIAVSQVVNGPTFFSKLSLLGCIALASYCFVDFPIRNPACLLLFSTVLSLSFKYTKLTVSKNRN